MIVTIKAKDVFFDAIMLMAAILILIQQDEMGQLLTEGYKGLLYAAILLLLLPVYHSMLVIHGVCQSMLQSDD